MKTIGPAFRAIINKPFYGKLVLPAKLSKGIFVLGKKKIFIEKRFRIMDNYRIECHGDGTIQIGENVSIGQNLHLVSGGKMLIGNNVTISGNVFISNLNHSFDEIDKHALNQKHEIKDVVIGDFSFIGYGACILPGVILGKNVIVGANAVVTKSVPDYSIVAGNPARIRGYRFTEEEIKEHERQLYGRNS